MPMHTEVCIGLDIAHFPSLMYGFIMQQVYVLDHYTSRVEIQRGGRLLTRWLPARKLIFYCMFLVLLVRYRDIWGLGRRWKSYQLPQGKYPKFQSRYGNVLCTYAYTSQ